MYPPSDCRQLRYNGGRHASPALPSCSVHLLSFPYLCSYISLCFAVVAKNVLDVKLQKKHVRKQAGRKARETKVEVEVPTLKLTIFPRLHSSISTRTSRSSPIRSQPHRRKSDRSNPSLSCTFVGAPKHPKNTFDACF